MTLRYGSKEYNIGLAHMGLRVYRRHVPEVSKWDCRDDYIVAPVLKHGDSEPYHKVGWQVYYYNSHFNTTKKTMKRYSTKKEAVGAVRSHLDHEPWYAGLPGYGTAQGVYLSDGVYIGGNPHFDR